MEPTSITLPVASGQLVTGRGCITYWSVRDTTASSGSVFELYDGQAAASQLLLSAGTVSKQSTSEYIRKMHCPFSRGVYYDLISGTLVGAVTVWMAYSEAEWQAILEQFTKTA